MENTNNYNPFIKELYENYLLSGRAYHILTNGDLDTLQKTIHYYLKNGNFMKFRNCGIVANRELIEFCEEYKNKLDENMLSGFDKDVIETNKQEENEKYDIFIKELYENDLLSVRAYHILDEGELYTLEKTIYYYLRNGNFMKFRNCGIKTDGDIIEFCEEYSNKLNTNVLLDFKNRIMEIKNYEDDKNYEQMERVIELFNQGTDINTIMEKENLSENIVKYILKEVNQIAARKRRLRILAEKVKLLVEEGHSQRKIAEMLGKTIHTINNIIKKQKIILPSIKIYEEKNKTSFNLPKRAMILKLLLHYKG